MSHAAPKIKIIIAIPLAGYGYYRKKVEVIPDDCYATGIKIRARVAYALKMRPDTSTSAEISSV